MTKYEPIDCGPLPVAMVNAVLPLNLKPGPVHFSVSAQRHADEKHPRDYPIAKANIAAIVRGPDWIGQGPHDRNGFTLVRRIGVAKAIILVAIKVKPDAEGRYVVASAYRLTEHDVSTRLKKGYLSPA